MGNACAGENVGPETVRLEYFKGGHGRAEPIRVLLHHANVRYVETPVGIPTWMMRKGTGNTGEFGALPIVYYQGRVMQQTGAILRSLGVQHGYYNPRDYQTAGKIDWIVDTWGELLTANANIVLSMSSAATKQAQFQELVTTKWRPFLAHCEK